MTPFFALVRHDVKGLSRTGGGLLLAPLFFVAVVVLVPFAVGPDLPLLQKISGGMVWIAALLAMILNLERLFQADAEDGTLDILLVSTLQPEMIVLGKMLAHWLTTALPLLLLSPVLAMMLNMEPRMLGLTWLTLLVGTPALSALGTLGAVVTVALKRGGTLLAFIILPLSIPLIIFAIAAIQSNPLIGTDFKSPFLLLCGISGLLVAVCPLAAAQALKEID